MRCLSLELLKEVNLAVTCAVLQMPLGPTTHPVQLMYIVSITFVGVTCDTCIIVKKVFVVRCITTIFEVFQGSAGIRGTVCRPERPG